MGAETSFSWQSKPRCFFWRVWLLWFWSPRGNETTAPNEPGVSLSTFSVFAPSIVRWRLIICFSESVESCYRGTSWCLMAVRRCVFNYEVVSLFFRSSTMTVRVDSFGRTNASCFRNSAYHIFNMYLYVQSLSVYPPIGNEFNQDDSEVVGVWVCTNSSKSVVTQKWAYRPLMSHNCKKVRGVRGVCAKTTRTKRSRSMTCHNLVFFGFLRTYFIFVLNRSFSNFKSWWVLWLFLLRSRSPDRLQHSDNYKGWGESHSLSWNQAVHG